uniref:WLM domain-containing protein n=1 Tax=viral metagenome TaxID=1070528 RepID=A0A6C0ESW1_9ZZZZ
MNKEDILGYVIIALILFISYKLYRDSDLFQLKCIVSNVDGDKYCVRERTNIQNASDLLAKTTDKMKTLVNYVGEKHKDKENMKRLVKKFNPKKIVETLPTSEYTAYSENKGQKIAFCLNKEKENDNNLIDENTLMFVALHEMAHVASKSIGHNKEFWDNFKFLIKEASDINLYIPIDYSKKNQEYCGMTISSSPFF